jgi:hypothetical protein
VADRPSPKTGDVRAAVIRNPDKGTQLARLGITIARQVATAEHATATNAVYLATKARRGGHDLLWQRSESIAEPHRRAGPLNGSADLGFESS